MWRWIFKMDLSRLKNYKSLICVQNLCSSIWLVKNRFILQIVQSEALIGAWSSFQSFIVSDPGLHLEESIANSRNIKTILLSWAANSIEPGQTAWIAHSSSCQRLYDVERLQSIKYYRNMMGTFSYVKTLAIMENDIYTPV